MATLTTFTANTQIKSAEVNGNFTGLSDGTMDIDHNSMQVFRDEALYDFVNSGGVWTADSAAVNRNASMTALAATIDGWRALISAVTSRTFTASKDTYIDILRTTTTMALVYTEVTNNAASPALASNSLRLGIIVTGATTIAAAASINQGQEDRVLPIASSIPYAVTDSLGNLICPRDPNRKLLGYRQIIANQSGFTGAATQITGLAIPVIVPTGRKVKVSLVLPQFQPGVAFGTGIFTLWEGTVGSGTQLQQMKQVYVNNDSTISNGYVERAYTPTSTNITINAAAGNTGTGGSTTQVNAAATAPTYCKVELE